MGKIKFRGGTLLAPAPPVMVTCGTKEAANIITVAWTGITNTIPPKTYISVRPKRHSHALIEEGGEFVLNLTPTALVKAADYCGTYTGAKVNKFEKCHLTKLTVEEVAVPLIAECPISLCCRVTDKIPLGSHDMFLADILAVYADEQLLDANEAIIAEINVIRAQIAFYHHQHHHNTMGINNILEKDH